MIALVLLTFILPFIGIGQLGLMYLPVYCLLSLIYLFSAPKTLPKSYLLLAALIVGIFAVFSLTPYGVFYAYLFLVTNYVGLIAYFLIVPLLKLGDK